MASDLNQYVWAWPFILESCGNEAHFAFDHFQLQPNGENEGELEYMGELRLSMAAYNAYLEKYLFGATTKDVVVVTDHATKKAVNIVVPDSLIVLNGLVIAEHCNQVGSFWIALMARFAADPVAGLASYGSDQGLPVGCLRGRHPLSAAVCASEVPQRQADQSTAAFQLSWSSQRAL